MKTFLITRSMRNSLVSAAAVSAFAVPLLAAASLKVDDGSELTYPTDDSGGRSDQNIARGEKKLDGQESLYQRLKLASHKVCEPSSHRTTRSLPQSVNNTEGYFF
jgi:hypothetical protein